MFWLFMFGIVVFAFFLAWITEPKKNDITILIETRYKLDHERNKVIGILERNRKLLNKHPKEKKKITDILKEIDFIIYQYDAQIELANAFERLNRRRW